MTEATVYLLRHGEVENPGRLRYGRLPGFSLSTRGREQVRRAGEFLAGRPASVRAVATSPLERARESAEIVREVLALPTPVQVDERLLEVDSVFDGMPRNAPGWAYAHRWLRGGVGRATEAPAAVARRVGEAVLEAARACAGGAAVLVSHQVPITLGRLALEHGLGSPRAPLALRVWPWAFGRAECGHASVTSLHLRDGVLVAAEYWASP